jgi:hypothetical protein
MGCLLLANESWSRPSVSRAITGNGYDVKAILVQICASPGRGMQTQAVVPQVWYLWPWAAYSVRTAACCVSRPHPYKPVWIFSLLHNLRMCKVHWGSRDGSYTSRVGVHRHQALADLHVRTDPGNTTWKQEQDSADISGKTAKISHVISTLGSDRNKWSLRFGVTATLHICSE